MTISDTSPLRDLPFASLVAFEATARLGSLSRAAEALNLTQSAVSQRVLKLEAYVGQRLFLRQGHGVKVTGAGALLLQTTCETLERLQIGLGRLEPYRNKASLLLACPADFAQGWLMPRLRPLQALAPGMEVWMMASEAVVAIDRIDIDLVVSRKPLHAPDIECLPLLEDRAVALCGPQTALALGTAPFPALLERAPLLFLEDEPQWGGLLAGVTGGPSDAHPAQAPRIRRGATIQDARLLLEAAELELGVAYLSQVLAGASMARGRTVPLPQVPSSPRPRLWLMRSRLTPRSGVVNRAFDWLLAEAGASQPTLAATPNPLQAPST